MKRTGRRYFSGSIRKGFTLVELMVVLVILGAIFLLFVLSMVCRRTCWRCVRCFCFCCCEDSHKVHPDGITASKIESFGDVNS